jgi:hypothetical protein
MEVNSVMGIIGRTMINLEMICHVIGTHPSVVKN